MLTNANWIPIAPVQVHKTSMQKSRSLDCSIVHSSENPRKNETDEKRLGKASIFKINSSICLLYMLLIRFHSELLCLTTSVCVFAFFSAGELFVYSPSFERAYSIWQTVLNIWSVYLGFAVYLFPFSLLLNMHIFERNWYTHRPRKT